MNNDALDNIKRLRDVLNEAIAALEAGRDVRVEEKHPSDTEAWNEVAVFRDRDYRCVVRPREVWVNEYPDGLDYAGLGRKFYDSREIADACARDSRIRCIRFVEAPPEENQ
ncbi:MAG: hypothetical protein GX625_17985 [Clostridiaceae bacterium]|jgi:hypothetical protein|nr:hypothetical protein [Clostridiaceae bacterium]